MAAEEEGRARAAAAEQRGWQQGYAAGRRQAQQEVAGVAQRLGQIAESAATDYATSAHELDRHLAGLALALARAVIQQEVRIAPGPVLAVAQAALRELVVDRTVTLRVHPQDAPLLQEHVTTLGLSEAVQIAILADVQVSPGGCVVQSGGGRIDATIEGQLTRLERLLHEQLDASVA